MTGGTDQTTLATGGTDEDPNDQQVDLIETIDGILLVDAGAGTGKTFTIARRYQEILDARGLEPDDVLLITFTNNAAEEMRERILHLGGVPASKLREAPIATFHSMARRVLVRRGFHAPRRLGVEEPLAPNFRVLEDTVLEAELFQRFLHRFRREHPEHADRLAALHDPANLLDLVKNLAAKGILPRADGWYRDGREQLLGDRQALLEAFEQVNERRGGRQSKLRSKLGGYRSKLFLPGAPTLDELREGDGKTVQVTWAKQAFDQDREDLLAFVHDVYLGYLTFALQENALNFSLLLALAYVLLVEDDELRAEVQRPYVMIDEFQDTSEIQFQLALLFSQEPNLCCVGDWKQSIYSFQYANVSNILAFQDRLARFTSALNADRRRVPFDREVIGEVGRIDLTENYRSTQAILDVAEEALVVPGRQEETLDEEAIREAIVHLHSNARHPTSRIEALVSDDEIEAVLAKLQAMVGEEAYGIEDDQTHELVAPSWGDIAVLTRTRSFALGLQERARELGIPMAFEGGVEVFATDPGKLLLAWLRLLEDPHSRRGWAVILELAGYTLDEADHILSRRAYPEAMTTFLAELAKLPSVGAQARAVFQRYGLRDGFTEALVETVQTSFEGTGLAPAELVRFIEDSWEANRTTEVDDDHGDVVTVQTIHAAKGLEYPIVVLADLNEHRFPSTGGGYPSVVRYREPLGLRASKIYGEVDGRAYAYDDWHAWFLDRCVPTTDYDEERRLFYVAMSRAKQHLILTAEADRPSPFLTHLPIEAEPDDQTPEPIEVDPHPDAQPLRFPTADRATARRATVGQLVGEPTIEGGKGRVFGAELHDLAARYVRGQATEPSNDDQERVAQVIDRFRDKGTVELQAEVPCALPVDIHGTRLVIGGTIDLLCRAGDRIEVVDWKTAPAGQGLETYERQVGLYAHIVQAALPDAEVHAWLHYSEEDEPREVDPLDREQVETLVAEHLDETA